VTTWSSPKEIDNTDERTKFFIYHGTTIFSLSTANTDHVLFTCRDCTGKYTWEVKPLWLNDTDTDAARQTPLSAKPFTELPSSPSESAPATGQPSQATYEEQVRYGVGEDTDAVVAVLRCGCGCVAARVHLGVCGCVNPSFSRHNSAQPHPLHSKQKLFAHTPTCGVFARTTHIHTHTHTHLHIIQQSHTHTHTHTNTHTHTLSSYP
jgi:hypothetical protein